MRLDPQKSERLSRLVLGLRPSGHLPWHQAARVLGFDGDGRALAAVVAAVVAAAVCVAPTARGDAGGRARLVFETFPGAYVDNDRHAGFPRRVAAAVRGLIVVHDNAPTRRGEWTGDLRDDFPWLGVEPFPPYAPDLNPAENVWAKVKGHDLANYAPDDVPTLDTMVDDRLRTLARDQRLLRSCLDDAPLPW